MIRRQTKLRVYNNAGDNASQRSISFLYATPASSFPRARLPQINSIGRKQFY